MKQHETITTVMPADLTAIGVYLSDQLIFDGSSLTPGEIIDRLGYRREQLTAARPANGYPESLSQFRAFLKAAQSKAARIAELQQIIAVAQAEIEVLENPPAPEPELPPDDSLPMI